jgi:flavin reductase (DIM6/NTAB) family NADH-FMN oxidoreductase RutF
MDMNMTEAFRATAPHPFAYVITRDEQEKCNAMGVSWWTFAAMNPPTLIISVGNQKHSLEVIRRTRRFSLCLPDQSLREQAKKVCQTSGAKLDKIRELGIELTAGQTGFPVLKQARACFECEVRQILDVGDHALCVAEIQAFSEDPEKEALRTSKEGYSL